MRPPSRMQLWLLSLLLLLSPAAAAKAQTPASPSWSLAPATTTEHGLARAAQEAARAGRDAFAIEATGGVAGSLLGFGFVYAAAEDCRAEDLGCNLETAFQAIALATGLSALTSYGLGRALHTEPSALGAVLGSVAGAAAGVGVWHLFTEEFDIVNNRSAAVAVYGLTQGVVTALGSRLVRALR